MVKVSIIMPSLNVRDYIEEAINSVVSQTLKEIEILCIDAGSTDGTWESIEIASKEDNRIRVIKSPIKSYGYQIGIGIDQALGEYVAILDTDDYTSADMYKALYEVAIREDLDFAKCDYSTYRTVGEKREFISRKVSADQLYYNSVFCPAEHPQTVIDDWYLWNGIYKRDFLNKYGIRPSATPGAAFQDVGFLHKVAAHALKGKYLKGDYYRYCVDREGASSNSNRVLHFIRSEYGLLLESSTDCATDAAKVLLYRRMARSFVRACMDTVNEQLEDGESAGICKWFQEHLSEAENYGFVSGEDLPRALQEPYRQLMNSVEAFVLYRKTNEKRFIEFLEKTGKIIIFGCGDYGKGALKSIRARGYDASAFMDNNRELWGETMEGIPVWEPEKTKELSTDFGILIANEKYADSIRMQLEDYRKDIIFFEYTLEQTRGEA